MIIDLRDYQQEALNTIISEYHAGVNSQLISLPTGSGKTILMAAIAKQFNKKTLLLAHREELITQADEKFKLFWPDVSLGVCMAERDEIDRQVVIGSIQSCSLSKRLNKLKDQGFDVLMIDEAHHARADSYQNLINCQIDYLEKKMVYKEGMTRGQASIEISKIVALKNKQRPSMSIEQITDKQKYFLQNHGVDASSMTKLQAMEEISKIKNEKVKYG